MSTRSISRLKIIKAEADKQSAVEDMLAVEEPMELRIIYEEGKIKKQKSLSVTMRTPGNDEDLAIGFLFTEGIIKSYHDVVSARHTAYDENIVEIALHENILPSLKQLERHFYTTSSCGVCGKSSIDVIRTVSAFQENNTDIKFSHKLLYKLPQLLHEQQDTFQHTGGLHASALFGADGKIWMLREDVGRHNALDKIVGAALKKDMLPLNHYILLLSGRASFELIQKAAMAGIKIVAAIGAPSSLAVSLAKEFDMTLVGFLKSERFNIYCGEAITF